MKIYASYYAAPRVLVTLGLYLACLPSIALAFSTGAGSCKVNDAAVGQSHLSTANDITTGAASGDTGYSLTIDGGSALTPNTAFAISLDPTHQLVFEALLPTSNFKGFSIILSAGEAADLTVVDAATQKDNTLCTGTAVGITHTNSDEKSRVEVTLNVDGAATSIPLDVTVVIQNSGGISKYYYSQYLLNFVEETKATPWDLISDTPALSEFAVNVATVPSALALLQSPTNTLTVFGPVDSAFANLENARVERILADPKFVLHLEDLMLYQIHTVTALSVNALLANAAAQQPLTMDNAQFVQLFQGDSGGGNFFVELNAQGPAATLINQADLPSTKSVLHTVNKLLLPPSATMDILAAGLVNPNFSTLLELMAIAELTAAAEGDGPLTLFAPSNAAFAKMDPEELAYLRTDKPLLTDILTYHVASGVVTGAELQSIATLTMLNGKATQISMTGPSTGTMTSSSGNAATFASVDSLVNNGLIHAIDTVLIPEAIILPSPSPSGVPSLMPSKQTAMPSAGPSVSLSPTASAPTTKSPTTAPSKAPSQGPSVALTGMPSKQPSYLPSHGPSVCPSLAPSVSLSPSSSTPLPTTFTQAPSLAPSTLTTFSPSNIPSVSSEPSSLPSAALSEVPTSEPTFANTTTPTGTPTGVPSGAPTGAPSGRTSRPTALPVPTLAATTQQPSSMPSQSLRPSSIPSHSQQPSSMPSLSPSIAFTQHDVKTEFLLFNTEGIKAKDLISPQYATPLNASFQLFVDTIVSEVQGQAQRRSLRDSGMLGERHLLQTLQSNSTELYNAADVTCPAATSDGASIPDSASCQDVLGRYVILSIGEDPTNIQATYQNATNQALEDGKLEESLNEVDPNSPFTVAGPPQAVAPKEDGMEWWLILIICLCSALGVGLLAFGLYYYLMQEDPPIDEDKDAMASQMILSQVVPPPPDAFTNIEVGLESDSWSADEEEDGVDDGTLDFFSDADETVAIVEDEVDESKDEAEDNDSDISDEEWEEGDTATNINTVYEDDVDGDTPLANSEALLELENGEASDNHSARGAALEDVQTDDDEFDDEFDDDDDDDGNAEGDSPQERHGVDPSVRGRDGDAPGARESEMGDEVTEQSELGDGASLAYSEAESRDSNRTGQSWQVPNVSIRDINDVEDILRSSQTRQPEGGE